MANTSYNRIIRKMVVGFGNLFKDITLVRYNPDLSEAERFLVPIVYATKELYVRRLEDDPDLSKKIMMTLPRMSFEMSGLTYDSSRKQNTNFKQFAKTSTGVISQYQPVPYNFDFNLYIYVRNIEDGTQIIEHIIPYFTPDYTIKLNLIPEMGITREIPIILNATTSEIEYEGDKDGETRTIIWTLNFTVKGFIFGKTTNTGLIYKSITNILNQISSTDTVIFNMDTTGIGKYQEGETVYQGYSLGTATATAKVISWDVNATNLLLHLTNINGNFVSDLPVWGMISNANYNFTEYNVTSQKPINLAEIIVTPNIIINVNGVTVSANSPSPSIPHSYYFNDTNYLQVDANEGFAFGTGDFTIECWVKLLNPSNYTGVATLWLIGDSLVSWDNSYNSWNWTFGEEGGYTIRPTAGVTFGSWLHVAYVRSSGVATVYYNGVNVGSSLDTNVYTTGITGTSYIGAREATYSTWPHDPMPGYISNFRVVKGTAVYTTNFTPPSVQLTNIPGTVLLTAVSDKIIDQSNTAIIPSNYTYTTNITEFPNIT